MINKLIILSLILLLTTSQTVIQSDSSTDYEYIIVGAGIAGIGASTIFSDKSIKHLMIEARDRIGGRIGKGNFSGITIDLGANFIHFPQNNYLNDLIDYLGIGKVPANFHIQKAFYTNRSEYSSADLSRADSVYKRALSFIKTQRKQLDQDVPVSSILSQFWSLDKLVDAPIVDRVNQQFQVEGVQGGADLTQLSTFELEGGGGKTSESTDYIPAGGWNLLLQTIYSQWCTPELHLNEVVREIDYAGDKIQVITSKNKYRTNRLFVSVPLGTLKAKTINFNPPLPADKQAAINTIGFGNFEKLFVSFNKAFWPAGSGTLHFVGQGKLARYVEGWVVPNTLGLNVLVFFVSGQDARTITNWSTEEIKNDLLSFLSSYTSQSISILDLKITNWSNDPYAYGSYSYNKVGSNIENFKTLQKPIVNGDNKIWLIGEHTDPYDFSYTQGAYESGQAAAIQALGISY